MTRGHELGIVKHTLKRTQQLHKGGGETYINTDATASQGRGRM